MVNLLLCRLPFKILHMIQQIIVGQLKYSAIFKEKWKRHVFLNLFCSRKRNQWIPMVFVCVRLLLPLLLEVYMSSNRLYRQRLAEQSHVFLDCRFWLRSASLNFDDNEDPQFPLIPTSEITPCKIKLWVNNFQNMSCCSSCHLLISLVSVMFLDLLCGL